MKIAIYDDEENARIFLRKSLEKINRQDEIVEFENTEQTQVDDLFQFDLIFLDIEMPKESGMQLAERIRGQQKKACLSGWGSLPLIIFVTGHKEYMLSAFSVHAFDYLVKPVKEEKLCELYKKAAEIMKKMDQEKVLLRIKQGGEFFTISVDEIIYVESNNRKNILHMQDKEIEYYGLLGDLEKELPDCFYRIHKGYIVNMKYIEHYNRTSIIVKGNVSLLLSKYRYQNFVNAYMYYLRERRGT